MTMLRLGMTRCTLRAMPKHVLVIGGGVIGLCSAWFALQRGYPNGHLPPADALDRAMASRRPGPGTSP